MVVAVLVPARVSRAQLAHDVNASFRAYGLSVGEAVFNGPDDEEDKYVELSTLGPVNVADTLTYTTQSGDTGTATASVNADADAEGIRFKGRATGKNVGNSPQFGFVTSSGYTDMQHVFTVAEATPVKITGAIEASDDDSSSFASFFLRSTVDETRTDLFDYFVESGDPKLDLTGGNAIDVTLQPGVRYTLFLQTQGFSTSASNETGSIDYDIAMTTAVPEPAGLAGVALAGAALAARRSRRRRCA